jgi:hypothetical protein
MTAKPPPVPPQNRSPKGVGDDKDVPLDQRAKGGTATDDPDKRGQQGNTRINTTPLRSQQDR